MTHICVSNVILIGSDNGLSPGQCQAIIWTNAGILLIGRLGTNSNYILIEISTFSFKGMHLNMSSGKWLLLCRGLNVLKKLCGHCHHHNHVWDFVIIFIVITNSHKTAPRLYISYSCVNASDVSLWNVNKAFYSPHNKTRQRSAHIVRISCDVLCRGLLVNVMVSDIQIYRNAPCIVSWLIHWFSSIRL